MVDGVSIENGVDGMGLFRVLLAVSVFMAHSSQTGFMSHLVGFGGENAVEVFFVISGFYIAMILERSYSTNLGFYKNRALRLYPIYYIICALVLVRCLFIPNTGTALFSFPVEALSVGALANSTFFGSDWIMFLQWNDNNLQFGNFNNSELPLWGMLLIPPSWSLGIEVTFYLLAPFLCKAKTRTILMLGIGLLALRLVAFTMGLNVDPWTYRFFPFELPMFLCGILLYRLKNHYSQAPKISLSSTYAALMAIYLLLPFMAQKFDFGRTPQLFVLVIVTAIIILFSPDNARDKKFGELSYPIYMSHVLIITSFSAVLVHFSEKISIFEKIHTPPIFLPVTLFSTCLFSFLLLRLVRPIERIREKNRK
jgi:peptidoglycan/LPS O-acetylase OafA/YrhL